MKGESGMAMLGAAGSGTSDPALASAAAAVTALSSPCDVGNSGTTIKAFQTAWNSTSDATMQSTPGASGPIGTLTVDGYYGPNTAEAVAAATGGQVTAACSTYTNIPGGGTAPVAPPAAPIVVASTGMSSAVKYLIVALIVGAVGVVGYVIWKRRKPGARHAVAEPKRRKRTRRRRRK